MRSTAWQLQLPPPGSRRYYAPPPPHTHHLRLLLKAAAAIISLGSALGVSVVAEGVEVSRQAAQLRALGCELAQGFLFAKPLPVGELSSLLRAERAAEDVASPSLTIDPLDVPLA